MPPDNLRSQLQCDLMSGDNLSQGTNFIPPILEYDHLLMIDGENLRRGAEKSSIFFNDSENTKHLISCLEAKIGYKFSCKKMISTKKESEFSKSF